MIIDELFEAPQQCPECGGISFSDLILAEKKDACYYKVKASAKVWPSAYASGRLVQCRKKGAANYGNKSESVAEGKEDKVKQLKQDYATAVHWSKNDTNPHKREAARQKAEKIKRHLETQYKQGVAEGSEPQVGDAVYYGKRLVGWFKGYSEHGKIITEPNYEEMGDEYANRDVYWDPQDKITIKPEQGMAEEQELDEKWSQKYKSSINCANPKGFSQRAHCAGRNKNEDVADIDEGGDVFMPNIQNTPEYKAGFATGKLPVPHPEGTQQYASYYKGVIDRASPTLSKVGEGEQQKGADYRDPKEVDYDDEYDAMVARVKRLAGLGPMKTVYDPNKRQYRNMPTAVQPKK